MCCVNYWFLFLSQEDREVNAGLMFYATVLTVVELKFKKNFLIAFIKTSRASLNMI